MKLIRYFIASAFLLTSPLAASAAQGGDFFNLRVLPLGALVGEYAVDLSVAPLKFLSIGAIGYQANAEIDKTKTQGSGYGGRATIHFSGNRFSEGWILSAYYLQVPEISATSQKSSLLSGQSVELTGKLTEVQEYGAVLGKMWMWDSGINMTLAAGSRMMKAKEDKIYLRSADGSATSETTFGGSSIRVEFALGYAF